MICQVVAQTPYRDRALSEATLTKLLTVYFK
jgi:hypothetical protein